MFLPKEERRLVVGPPFDVSLPGSQLFRDLLAAVEQRDRQREFFAEFNSTIPSEVSRQWEDLIQAFEEDPTGPNPYEETETGKCFWRRTRCLSTDFHHRSSTAITLKDVQLELAQEEAEEVSRGVMSLHETTASVFLATGIELEEQQ